MADRSLLQRGPGTRSDRAQPTGWLAPEGDYAWVFGNDQPGWTGRFATFDGTRIEQTDSVGAAKLVTVRGFFRGPLRDLPAGWRWEVYGGTATEDRFVFELRSGTAREMTDLAFSTRGYTGALRFGLRARGPANVVEELEIPAAYLDAIVLDPAPATIVLANMNPIADETDVPRPAHVKFDLIETGSSTIDLATVLITINGVLAYDGSNGGDQPGYVSAITSPATGHSKFDITMPYLFDSMDVVPVRVIAQNAAATGTIDETYSFTAEDFTAPRVVSAQATYHDTIIVNFHEPVVAVDAANTNDALHPSNYYFQLLTAPSVTIEVVSVEQLSPTSFALTTDIPMTQHADYVLFVEYVEDPWGNAVEAPYDRAPFTGYACDEPENRRFELWRMLARINRDEDVTRDLFKFIAILQEPVDLLLCDVDRWTDILDVDIAAERYVDQMLIELGNPFDFDLTLTQKRKLVRILIAIYRQKGTAVGIINVIRFFLGLTVTIEVGNGTGWQLNSPDELGVDSVLGPGTAYERFSFSIVSGVVLTESQRRFIRSFAEYMKPAHTHLVNIVEPTTPVVIDHVVLGISLLDTQWLLH